MGDFMKRPTLPGKSESKYTPRGWAIGRVRYIGEDPEPEPVGEVWDFRRVEVPSRVYPGQIDIWMIGTRGDGRETVFWFMKSILKDESDDGKNLPVAAIAAQEEGIGK